MYLGLAIMCGFVLFDTQLIIEKAEMGDKDYIWCVTSQYFLALGFADVTVVLFSSVPSDNIHPFHCLRHCVDLFLDFVTIFRKLMVILAMNEKVCQPPQKHTHNPKS